ncbi:hypothetical protein CZ774_08970 [Frigoribacterium sp. JB110]|nr:hypothetical protein CZ774_08970 [Frigoribacterium sp. JB110]
MPTEATRDSADGPGTVGSSPFCGARIEEAPFGDTDDRYLAARLDDRTCT